MKIVGILLCSFLFIACSTDKQPKEAKVDVSKTTPEYKAYDLVQALDLVKEIQRQGNEKNQPVSLQLSKDFLNGSTGYYWFRVVQRVGAVDLVKLNVKVREKTFVVTILDEDTGEDLSPESYAKKMQSK
ncbi:MAG TPA: hypothetical protein PLI97_08440 [Fluviicola sp.]|nr:hypothetical protein [Fluviicola sp.]